MAKDTKKRILDAALDIFARDGYAGTNIKDIAESVGIVKSALYKHFDSKEEIWSAVLDQIGSYYENQMVSPEDVQTTPENPDELLEYTMKMVGFTVNDEKIVRVRKVIVAEQFRDEKTRECANRYFVYRNESLFEEIFANMMEKGTLRKCDPKLLAFTYTAPITLLVHYCDREPERKAEAMKKMESLVKLFVSTYGIKQSA